MMAQIIDRQRLKADMRELLRNAQVNPRAMTALYVLLSMAVSMLGSVVVGSSDLAGIFLTVLSNLINMVLGSGFVLYCMAIRRGERAEFLTLFDGFSFVGKIIVLNLITYMFIALWSMLFVIPGIIAGYRYRFALYNLYENPGISAMEALDMSKRQTLGYKAQLFMLDFSYFGWIFLASLPLFFMELSTAAEVGAAGAVYSAILPSWGFGWGLLINLWSAAVSLFYLPNYQCVELGYFEIAKQTSGIGQSSSGRPGPQDSRGPDQLGGC